MSDGMLAHFFVEVAMHCPRCQHNKTGVMDSRPRREGTSITRRRKCFSCGHKFTTTEIQMVSISKKALIEDRISTRVRALEAGIINDLRVIISGADRETA